MPIKIALVGTFGTGKTSIADAICALDMSMRTTRISFAAALKQEVADALAGVEMGRRIRMPLGQYTKTPGVNVPSFDGLSREHVGRMADIATKDEYRTILQWWGTEYRRAQNPLYWLDAWQAQYQIARANRFSHFTVDDARFDNEHDLLVSLGFKFVALAPGPTARDQGPVAAAHASEQDWTNWPVDLYLSFEPGPEHQAQRILAAFDGVWDTGSQSRA